MTQEDKELLLKDLCARLPYGVITETTWKEKVADENCDGTIGKLRGSQIEFFEEGEYSDIKPYLRPMSSMTKEEEKEFQEIKLSYHFDEDSYVLFDWLNAHHFDYRGLIEKGLALEAPEGMYNLKLVTMTTIKKIILLALTIFVMVGCGDYQGKNQGSIALTGYSDIEIDSCQYIIGYNVLAHKGNCRLCKERRQKELEELIIKLKEK